MMERFLRTFVLGGVLPLYSACSCDPRKVVRSPESLAGVTIPLKLDAAACSQICGQHVTKCQRVPMTDAPVGYAQDAKEDKVAILCEVPSYCPGGRRPAGLEDSVATAGLGGHFAELARLEASAVHAFTELALELELHGAPRELIDEARRAARDEVRHALVASMLARRYGAEPVVPQITPIPPRDLEAVLVDNAAEGLVHERYGATLAAMRAARAHDPLVRGSMQAIARDEATHATHALAVHAWGRSRIPLAARKRVDEARVRALDDLREGIGEPTAALAGLGGMPSATRAHDLLPAM